MVYIKVEGICLGLCMEFFIKRVGDWVVMVEGFECGLFVEIFGGRYEDF